MAYSVRLIFTLRPGDRRPVALHIGRELGLQAGEIHAEMLPEDKVRLIADAAKERKIAFVGDGANDAAALARADVGIAMGAAGSKVALQAADVALLSEDLGRLAAAHRLSKRTATVIRQNLMFAIGAMLILVIGAAMFDLPLPLAVVGHEDGTVLVVLNGLRLLHDPIRNVSRPVAQAMMRGVNATIVGILGAALYDPVWTTTVHSPRDFGIALVSFVLLVAWRTPPLVVVAFSAAAGMAMTFA